MLSKKIRAYKEAHPNAKAKEIAEALGVKVPYVYQILSYKPVKPKKTSKATRPSAGQETLRKEINRLNNEIDKYKNLSNFHEDKINFLMKRVSELKAHHTGLEYVISYLESRLGIEAKNGASV